MNSYPNIVIPIAGKGQRFKDAGYTQWKPFIDVKGKPMVQCAIECLPFEGKLILVATKGFQTEGMVNTVLLIEDQINNNIPLIIVGCDQIFEAPNLKLGDEDGIILTFKSTDPKWSFVEITDGYISKVAEKEPISDNANVGIYIWKKGSDFVKYAKQMIAKDIRVNNEFYCAPVYNEAIADGKKIKAYQVDKMWGLGTPEDLDAYIKSGQ